MLSNAFINRQNASRQTNGGRASRRQQRQQLLGDNNNFLFLKNCLNDVISAMLNMSPQFSFSSFIGLLVVVVANLNETKFEQEMSLKNFKRKLAATREEG